MSRLPNEIHILIYQSDETQPCPHDREETPTPKSKARRVRPPAPAVAGGRARQRRQHGSIRTCAPNWCRCSDVPGEAVSEAEIALSYGVSRTPVREAILKLSDEGLLEIFPQSGIFVSRIPLAALPEAIVIRKALEDDHRATRRASARPPSQILDLHSILERQREANAAGDGDAFHQADETFHAAIAEVAGYPGIWKLIQQVKVHVDRYRRLTLPQSGRIGRVIGEHEAILHAIEAHDPERRRGSRWNCIWKDFSPTSPPRKASIRSSSTSKADPGKQRTRPDQQDAAPSGR